MDTTKRASFKTDSRPVSKFAVQIADASLVHFWLTATGSENIFTPDRRDFGVPMEKIRLIP